MNLKNLTTKFVELGCKKIYIKLLAPNDNSKNQVYFGGNFEILNILPISNIINEEAGDWTKERFKAKIDFSWISNEGEVFPAPNAQLILYPKYPEVRFSGFLLGCQNAPSELMTQRTPDRLLLFSVTKFGKVVGYVTSPESLIAQEFKHLENILEHGIFKVIELPEVENNRIRLLNELMRIHHLGWIKSKSLTKNGIVPCEASQCGGYTLEAELGIIRNGYAEPDYLGWEVKNFGVLNFNKINSKVITLFTPEPTGGIYKNQGVEFFLRKYGYADKRGREDRINFGGVHKVNIKHSLTGLELKLVGYDFETGKIRNSNGSISLVDAVGNETASWSFSELLLHWNKKHNQACYVPSLSSLTPERKYQYGNIIILGSSTDFQLFLKQMSIGNIYYDPGIKMENSSTNPTFKKRSQFRIKSQFLPHLYNNNEIIDIANHN